MNQRKYVSTGSMISKHAAEIEQTLTNSYETLRKLKLRTKMQRELESRQQKESAKHEKSTQTTNNDLSDTINYNRIKIYPSSLINFEMKLNVEKREHPKKSHTTNESKLSQKKKNKILKRIKDKSLKEIAEIDTATQTLDMYQDIILKNKILLKNYREEIKEKLIKLYNELGSKIDNEEIENKLTKIVIIQKIEQ